MNDDIAKDKKSLIIKIAIPVIIILMVAGIWIYKNAQKSPQPVNNDNPDFALHVTEKLDLEKLKSYGLPIIIDFGADSCIPCKEMAPVLKELNENLRGKAIIKFVDVWKYQSFADGYPISAIPTQVFIDVNGKPYNPKDKDALDIQLFLKEGTNEHIFTAHTGGLTKEQLYEALKEMGMK